MCPRLCAGRGRSHAGSLLCSAPSQEMGWHMQCTGSLWLCFHVWLFHSIRLQVWTRKIPSLGSHELKHSREEATMIMHELPRLQTFPPQHVLLSFHVTGQDLSRGSICNTELFWRSREQAKGRAGCYVHSSIWASRHGLCPEHRDFPELGHSSLDWTAKGNYLITPWKLHL